MKLINSMFYPKSTMDIHTPNNVLLISIKSLINQAHQTFCNTNFSKPFRVYCQLFFSTMPIVIIDL